MWTLCGFIPIRNMWYQQHNVHPPPEMPGGWSSHGQPVDQVHGVFRKLIRQKDLASTGQVANLRTRPRYLFLFNVKIFISNMHGHRVRKLNFIVSWAVLYGDAETSAAARLRIWNIGSSCERSGWLWPCGGLFPTEIHQQNFWLTEDWGHHWGSHSCWPWV